MQSFFITTLPVYGQLYLTSSYVVSKVFVTFTKDQNNSNKIFSKKFHTKRLFVSTFAIPIDVRLFEATIVRLSFTFSR
jgi:hypothetical protein